MKFHVLFFKSGGAIMKGVSDRIGLDTVDWARKEIKSSKFPLSEISGETYCLGSTNLFLEVTEKQARSLPRSYFYHDGHNVQVNVTHHLNDYLVRQVIPFVHEGLPHIEVSFTLSDKSKKAIVRDWIKAGAPLIW